MAIGLDTSGGGGVAQTPSVPGLGDDQWAMMSGMSPGHPLVGGYAGQAGFLGGQRKISTIPNQTAAIASGNPSYGHWSQIMNLRSNPVGWVLIIALLYLTMHHFAGVPGMHKK